jgi:hypothetical protein
MLLNGQKLTAEMDALLQMFLRNLIPPLFPVEVKLLIFKYTSFQLLITIKGGSTRATIFARCMSELSGWRGEDIENGMHYVPGYSDDWDELPLLSPLFAYEPSPFYDYCHT